MVTTEDSYFMLRKAEIYPKLKDLPLKNELQYYSTTVTVQYAQEVLCYHW